MKALQQVAYAHGEAPVAATKMEEVKVDAPIITE
jgi:hypothetical protein